MPFGWADGNAGVGELLAIADDGENELCVEARRKETGMKMAPRNSKISFMVNAFRRVRDANGSAGASGVRKWQ